MEAGGRSLDSTIMPFVKAAYNASRTMLTLPKIPATFVDRYRGGSYGLYSYQADSKIETRTAVGCRAAGASFELRYVGLESGDVTAIIAFWEEIRLDFEAGYSLLSFLVPKKHPVWNNLRIQPAVVRHMLHAESLDVARWLVKEPSEISVPDGCGLHNWSCRIEECVDEYV